jgi:hypothetical protein
MGFGTLCFFEICWIQIHVTIDIPERDLTLGEHIDDILNVKYVKAYEREGTSSSANPIF